MKKWISILLAVCMTLSLFSGMVFVTDSFIK